MGLGGECYFITISFQIPVMGKQMRRLCKIGPDMNDHHMITGLPNNKCNVRKYCSVHIIIIATNVQLCLYCVLYSLKSHVCADAR